MSSLTEKEKKMITDFLLELNEDNLSDWKKNHHE